MHIFDLEQEIITCWRAADDMKALADSSADEEELRQALRGLSVLYQIQFEQLFNTFEKHVQKFHESRRANQIS